MHNNCSTVERGMSVKINISNVDYLVIKYLIYSILHTPEHEQRVMTNLDDI